MPIQIKLVNFDTLFSSQTISPVIINYIDVFNSTNKEFIDSMLMKNYDTDQLSIIPSCSCGELKGNFYIGQICPKCNTPVTSLLDNNLSFLIWLAKPQSLQSFISPVILNTLLNRYRIIKPSVRLVEYILLPNFKFDKKVQKKNLDKIEKLDYLLEKYNIKRGYNSFIENFFTIIDILEENFNKTSKSNEFKEYLLKNKENIFSNYLPFPNKILFSMESNELGKFIDKSLLKPLNVVRRLTGIDIKSISNYNKQNRIATSLIDLADFYTNYFKTAIFNKAGLIRQHITSTRSHFTARGVITSIYGAHEYDEVHIPWVIAINLLREHILNRLYVRGYNYKQASKFIAENIASYNSLLDEIFNEIINDSAKIYSENYILKDMIKKGLPCLLVRNPSLHRGSIQLMRITKVKTEVNDYTISLSVLSGPPFNMDFDGDELNLTLLLTDKEIKHAQNFLIHHNVLSLSGPNEFASGNIKLSKTDISTLTNFFHNL